MDRRNTLKSMLIGAIGVSAGTAGLSSCKETPNLPTGEVLHTERYGIGRTPQELAYDMKLAKEKFLSDSELESIATLADIILPTNRPENASLNDIGMVEFIDFMSKDIPDYRVPLKGGLGWLNYESNRRFSKPFNQLDDKQRIEIIDDIAYPDKAAATMKPGVSFFNLVRNLVTTGYYTSRAGMQDLGYVGNRPNVWDGVPEHVLKKHNLSYDKEWLKKCVDQDKRDVLAQWDENGNLIT